MTNLYGSTTWLRMLKFDTTVHRLKTDAPTDTSCVSSFAPWKGVRNMFYDYAYAQADQLEKMQLDLYNKTGIAWNDSLAEESDLDEIEDMETSNTS